CGRGGDFLKLFYHPVRIRLTSQAQLRTILDDRQTLPKTVMQFGCNALPFFVLQHEYPGGQVLQGLLTLFSFADIHTGSDVAQKISIRTETWDSGINKPSVLSICPLQTIFHCEGSSGLDRRNVVIHTWLRIRRVYPPPRAPPELLLHVPAGNFQPLSIKKRTKAISPGNPDHDWSGVCQHLKSFVT